MPETKGEFKQRLLSEGRLDEYLSKRAVLVNERQLKSAEAHRLLLQEYGPGAVAGTRIDVRTCQIERPEALRKEAQPETKTELKDDEEEKAVVTTLATFEGKSCDERECIRWVFEHLHLTDVKPDSAPSAGAWGLLLSCRKYPKVLEAFLSQIWPKLLPTRGQMEGMDKFSDDGREQIALIQKVRTAREKAEAKA